MWVLGTLVILSLTGVSLSAPSIKESHLPLAQPCSDECKLPACRCESTNIPGGLSTSETPQFVFLTFDDAVRSDNFDYYKEILFDRKNPDGCNVSATLFISHEYTVYPKVHELYENGFEIALHSITHHANTTYWQSASNDLLEKEFGGEKKLISKFANIPEDVFHGIRVPFLQLSGNNSFEVIQKLGLKYDCSWPTRNFVKPGLWPYTLDYKTTQDCAVGPCPTASIPGVWVVPMLDLVDQKNIPCAMADQCVNIPSSADNITDWLKTNFLRNYYNNKAPFGIYVHATWFIGRPEHVEAYKNFVDYLQKQKDVYIVGINRALEWIQNPVPIKSKKWPSCPIVPKSECESLACKYLKDDGSEIYMYMCNDGKPCPPYYPSLDHPLGI